MEYQGFCTCEVKYLGNSHTEETNIVGKMEQNNGFDVFEFKATEVSCRIDNLTLEQPMKIVLWKDGNEIKHIESEGVQHDFYIDYYPPAE